MTSTSLSRAAAYLSLLLPLTAACLTDDHDVGSDNSDDASGHTGHDGTDAGDDAAATSEASTGVTQEASTGREGEDSGASEGGHPAHEFACGSSDRLTCDGSSQYCKFTEGGPISPDGSVPMSHSCEAIPVACANDTAGAAATCACLEAHGGGHCTVSNGSDLTVTFEDP